MDGVVTILEDDYYRIVQDIWQDLHRVCDLQNSANLTVPHFSWHVAQAYRDEAGLSVMLEKICQQISPFTVRTTGIGLFFQPRLVIYIPVVKTQVLMDVHRMLWEELAQLAEQPLSYYAPEMWVPHITLIHEELSNTGLSSVLSRLSTWQFEWDLQVNNLALIGQSASASGTICIQHSLRGGL
jgi:2'-5' RNA ligase